MQETYQQLWRSLRLYSSTLPPSLAQQYIRSRWRDLRRKRLWSWRVGITQIVTPAAVTTGTVTLARSSNVVTGTSTAWDPSILGLQFRIGTTAPIYTIVQWNSPTSITIDQPFGGLSVTNVGYQIFMGYITPTPTDFQDWISVRDVFMNWRLHLHTSQEWLDTMDAQRAQSGTPYCLADLAYNTTGTGTGSVGPATQVNGSGPGPFASGLYTGFTTSVYVITITTGGVSGTAQFTWRQDNGTTNGPLPTTETPFLLSNGVQVQFPVGAPVTYVSGDIFVIPVQVGFTASMPMYELWPYQMNQRVYPALYDKRFPDADDQTWTLPRYIDGDVLVKGALADVCRWAGTPDIPNPMFNVANAASFEKEFQVKVAEMEREDDEVYLDSVRYQLQLPMASGPFEYGADFMQSHDFMATV